MRRTLGIHNIIGESAWTLRIRKRILQVAGYNYSVLITGPTGTGKELIARAIHMHGPRAVKPFIPVNCAALPGGLFASQVFGHEKGAFTGAAQSTLGCFRAAEGGTIFLDEIGDLDVELQAKLLRVLQERKVVPVGSHEGIPIDVRVIAATNRKLEEEVRAGRFRLDLFYRLNVISIETAPLRDRPEDIPILARHFLARAAVENGSTIKEISPAALELMQAHDWAGNIRELQNLIERAVVFGEGQTLGPECFPQLVPALEPLDSGLDLLSINIADGASTQAGGYATNGTAIVGAKPQAAARYKPDTVWPTLMDIERNHIARTLQETFYNQSAAARLLGIDRKLLARKIKRFGIRMPATQSGRSVGRAD